MDVNIKLTIKACCLYEHMTGRSFFQCNNEDDILHLLYAMFVTTNDSTVTYRVFLSMLSNKRLMRSLMASYNDICKYLEQLRVNEQIAEYNKGATGDTTEEMTITRVATSLIIQHGMDASYVMDKMQIWEIMPYLEAAESKRRMELIDKRFWTYLTILPHVDGKKLKSPDKLFKFDWEDDKKKYQKDLDEKAEFIKAFFEAQRKAKEAKKKMEEKEDGNG